jgi:hypothetical protein
MSGRLSATTFAATTTDRLMPIKARPVTAKK